MMNKTFYENFFTFGDCDSTRNFRGQIELDSNDCFKALRGELDVSELTIRHLEGEKAPKAIFWNGVIAPFCINEELKTLFEENEITGASYIPAKVKDKAGVDTDDSYFAICIHGRIDAIDYFCSDVIFEESPSGMIVPKFKGLFFDEQSWDGTDFIMERADQFGHTTAKIYVSEKVRNLFKHHKISFVTFKPIMESTVDADNIIRDSDEYMRKLRSKIRKATPKKWLIQKAAAKIFMIKSIKWDLL